jgi:hypothetical protein
VRRAWFDHIVIDLRGTNASGFEPCLVISMNDNAANEPTAKHHGESIQIGIAELSDV